MRYLIDSDWVASYLNGRSDAVNLLGTLAPDGLAISLITYGEIYEGIYYGSNPPQHERGFRHFLELVDVLPLSKLIMRRFARIRGELRQCGQLILDPDLLIAATALHHELTLVTGNTNHFQRIPTLVVYEIR